MKRYIIDNKRKNLGKVKTKKKMNVLRIYSVLKEFLDIRKSIYLHFKQNLGNIPKHPAEEIINNIISTININKFKNNIQVKIDPTDPNKLLWTLPFIKPTTINFKLSI